MKSSKWFGFFGFLGFQGIAGIMRYDWVQAISVVWFVWFIYFFIDSGSKDLIGRQKADKEENLKKLRDLFKTQAEVSNDYAQKTLRVSDATAENYLDELEKRGEIIQVGRTGQSVFYKLKS
jgi:hypothetical protein